MTIKTRVRRLEARRTQAKKRQSVVEIGHVYAPRWIREQYGIEDPISEAIDEYFDSGGKGGDLDEYLEERRESLEAKLIAILQRKRQNQ